MKFYKIMNTVYVCLNRNTYYRQLHTVIPLGKAASKNSITKIKSAKCHTPGSISSLIRIQ